ncbi:hypothetical protein CRUP_037955 [Coryphaenoides rupestris]|nr:hypothetical protein CRUP_037955 [Coryphaenoides rupestris]
MQQLEPVTLTHVLQTVCVLEGVILRSFGPDGGHVLFTRDTGQLMLSRSGKRILTALRLDHPLARMVVECAWKHSEVTGDGSKTFILLLAALLRGIESAAGRGSIASHAAMTRARHTAHELLAFGLEELGEVIRAGVDPHAVVLSWEGGGRRCDEEDPPHSDSDTDTDTETDIKRLLSAFFYTRLGRTHARLMSCLTSDLISPWRCAADPPSLALRFLEKNFAALHTPVCGLPSGSSRLVEGQVIHRDFATEPPPQQEQQQPLIKAVALFGCSLQPSVEGVVLKVGGSPGPVGVSGTEGHADGGILKYSVWAERSLEEAIGTLRGLGVTLLLCAGKQSEAALARARCGGICVVECVDKEELSLFAELSGARPAVDCRWIGRENVAQLAFCKPIVLGAHRYVHVVFATPELRGGVQPHSLVLCGAGEGQAVQCARAVRDALCMLLTMWEPWQRSAEDDDRASSHPHKQTDADTETRTRDHADSSGASFRKGTPDSRCVLPAGGAFEFLLHRALLQQGSQACSSVSQPPARGGGGGGGCGGCGGGGGGSGGPALCQLLADALLSIPRRIYSHRPRHFLQRLSCMGNGSSSSSSSTWLCSGLQRNGDDGGERNNVSAAAGEQSRGRDAGLESVFCKYQLVLAVLQCLSRVLSADAVLHKVSRAKASAQDTDDEDDEDEDDDDDDEQ